MNTDSGLSIRRMSVSYAAASVSHRLNGFNVQSFERLLAVPIPFCMVDMGGWSCWIHFRRQRVLEAMSPG